MKPCALISFVFLFFMLISCDSGLKFENPNDPHNQNQSASDGIKPPKPLIHVSFEHPVQYPMSYRAFFDNVQMNLGSTCVSDPDNPEKCLNEWEDKYYIQYKWEMTESPTPDSEESQLKLTDSNTSTDDWLPDFEMEDNPKEAFFTPLVTTPVRYDEENKSFNEEKCSSECGKEPSDDQLDPDKYFFRTLSEYFLCRQKYCEKNVTKYYKINIQAETVDKTTKVSSDTAEVTVVPRIVPHARVVVQLTWKQGFHSHEEASYSEGTTVDLDLHFIKKTSIEAQKYGFKYKEGLMGTAMKTKDLDCFIDDNPECEKYYRHDDCSFMDNGYNYSDTETIAWHASLDMDNYWGGNNYDSPETIGLGPVDDHTQDGIPDVNVLDDMYLVVVNYSNCTSNYSDGLDRCAPSYSKEDSAYEVDARVDILVDGEPAPRDGTPDSYDETTKNFKIKPNEWKVIAVVKWDNKLQGPESMQKYQGNAIVTDKAAPKFGIEADPANYPTCIFDTSDANIIPIWNVYSYYEHITNINYETNSVIGTCDKKPILDNCPEDPDKTEPGICGCGVPDTDSDGDGTVDCIDYCPDDPYKTEPGNCGCGEVDYTCGCGVPDTDSDGDGTIDCFDSCPDDPYKTEPGSCGCGVSDIDSDGNGTVDCFEYLPDDDPTNEYLDDDPEDEDADMPDIEISDEDEREDPDEPEDPDDFVDEDLPDNDVDNYEFGDYEISDSDVDDYEFWDYEISDSDADY